MSGGDRLYALVGVFDDAERIVGAATALREAGWTKIEGHTPWPVEGLSEALGQPRSRMPLICLLGGLFGGGGAYFMMWWSAVVDYPWNIGGRPYNSWPSFVPITFELTVLGASLATVLGMLIANGLPRPHHPIFNTPGFRRASRDRLYLAVEADDPLFDAARIRAALLDAGALRVQEAPL